MKILGLKYQLDFWGTLLFALIIIIGLRHKFAAIDGFLNIYPHFFQFDMYVFDMRSPTNPEIMAPDFFIQNLERVFTVAELQAIQPTLGPVIAADRWRINDKVISKYFCATRHSLGINSASFVVRAEFIKNSDLLVVDEVNVKCD